MKKLFDSRINMNLLKYNLRQHRALFVVYFTLLFTTYPLPIIIQFLNKYRLSYMIDDIYLFKPYVMVAITIVLAVITPFIVFNYLNSKKAVDVFHSLPIKRSDLLFTLSINSSFLFVVPFLLNYFIGVILGTSFGYVVNYNFVISVFLLCVMLIIIQSISIFVIMNTGTMSDGIVHTLILIALPYILYTAFNLFASNFIFGMKGFSWENLKYLSPIFTTFMVMNDNYLLNTKFVLSLYWIIVFIAFSAITIKLYDKRKSENSEMPFVNERYFPTVVSIFTSLIFIILNVGFSIVGDQNNRTLTYFLRPESLALATLITFVGYTVLNFFRYRSVKFFLRSSLKYVIVWTSTIVVCSLLIVTQIFGLVWRVPSNKDIDRVGLAVAQLSEIHPIFGINRYAYPNSDNYEPTLTSDHSIDEFTTFHKSINRRLKNQKRFVKFGDETGLYDEAIIKKETYTPISFTYFLDSGRRIRKDLSIPVELTVELTSLLNDRDYQMLANPILNSEAPISEDIYLYNSTMTKYETILADDFKKELQNAYFKDLETLGNENLAYDESSLEYVIEYSYISNFTYEPSTEFHNGVDWYKLQSMHLDPTNQYLMIDTRFPNTINYLKQFKVDKVPPGFKYSITDATHKIEIDHPASYGTIALDDSIIYESSQFTQIDADEASKLKISGTKISQKQQDILIINNRLFLPIQK